MISLRSSSCHDVSGSTPDRDAAQKRGKMGKAGIIVIPIVVVLSALLFIGGTLWLVHLIEKSEDKNPKSVRKNAELSDEAVEIFKGLLFVADIDGDIDLLSERSKTKIKSWLTKYRKVNE